MLSIMFTVDELRRNDPALRSITIALRHHGDSDADLAQALAQNPFVTQIELDFALVRTTHWRALLPVIGARENLVNVTLRDALLDAEEGSAPPTLVQAFLRSIQQNNSIRYVRIDSLRLPTDVSTFVDTASSITTLVLKNCIMEAVEREQGARDLAAALQRNTNIKTLELVCLDAFYTTTILQSLRANTCLKSFEFYCHDFQEATCSAIQQLLESSTSIETFGLGQVRLTNGQLFRPVAQAIISSERVSGLKFSMCRFDDEETRTLFQSVLRNKRNLATLSLAHCSDLLGREQVQETLFEVLLKPDSPLRCLEMMSLIPGIQGNRFEKLLRAIEKSKLEQFSIGAIRSQPRLQSLTQSIPLMRIKELQVVIGGGLEENEKQVLLLAVMNNFSLRSVHGCRIDGADLFDDEEKKRLTFYAHRNERLDHWVDNPEMVDRKLWPEALTLTEKAGPDSLFRGLRSTLGGDSVSLQSGRKRKRPQFYAP